MGIDPQDSGKENARMTALWHKERATGVDWSRRTEVDSKRGFSNNDSYENGPDLFMCLTILRGIHNSLGEVGEELMISTKKFNEKQTVQERKSNNGILCGST